MPSPFHQKYSSQNHKFYGDGTTAMPEAPKQDADRRTSDASLNSNPSSPTDRRRSSAARFANLESLKRPTDQQSIDRRSSLQDSYGKQGVIGSMWNNFTRGPSGPSGASPPKKPEARDTTTLRS